ncbi:MAG TPA: hypothetical protein VF796_02600 [Humisphaera sp.]
MPFKCPACQRPLYNRRRPDCEFCGAVLPAGLLLSPIQVAMIDKEKRDMEAAARQRQEEDRRQADARDSHWNGGG